MLPANLQEKLLDQKNILLLYLLLAVAVAIQSYHQGITDFGATHYNNYVIFKHSFAHLINGQDLFIHYEKEYFDLYKYSPTFALFMGLFWYLPDLLGLALWNVLNVVLLYWGLKKLPFIKYHHAAIAMWIVLLEMVTSIQNEQSNAMIAGLIIWSFTLLEDKKNIWAALCIVITVYIKLFGIVAFALYLLYPQRWKLVGYTIFWTIFLAVIPLLVCSWDELLMQYQSWGNMLGNDHSASLGYSVMGWFESWFGWLPNKASVVLIGAGIFCLPYLRFSKYNDLRFRLLFLASVLLWIVIFNHKAESPTFVIALSGVAIWFFAGERNILDKVLLFLVLLFTSLASTDLFPKPVRLTYIVPYTLKAVPCILVWVKIMYELLIYPFSEKSSS